MPVKAPCKRDIKRLFALSRNQCAFPGCTTAIVQASGTVTGKVCHIKAESPTGPRYDATQTDKQRHGFDNLILLCSVHHDIVDDQPMTFTVEVLKEMKRAHEKDGDIELTPDSRRLARRLLDAYVHIEAGGDAQVMVGSPGGILAKNITIKTGSKRKPAVPLPPDAIGSSIEMRSYVEYLTKRYIDWRHKGMEAGIDRRQFHPSMIHQLVARRFGARTFLVPQSRFTELVEFLQAAIDDTIWGRNSRARNYHSFEEHLEQVRGKTRTPEEDANGRTR